MQVAMVHFHLNRGGVTQVIINHLRALAEVHQGAEPLEVVIFFGGRRAAWRDELVAKLEGVAVRLVALPELQYDGERPVACGGLAGCLLAAFRDERLDPADTVVHIHNHSLGKNMSLPGAIGKLARAGFALLLQIHDFAEDFRPANYRDLVDTLSSGDHRELATQLYPQGSAIHYAVLNGRDYRILQAAGIAPAHIHSLPNPVTEAGPVAERQAARAKITEKFRVPAETPYILYPVRGIRRKNLGELLLWSAAQDRSARFAVTLPPLNPVEQPRYQAWKELSEQLGLPVLFEVGAEGGLDFSENLAAADRVLTTSVAEGFGMVFLEPWLADLPLIGRDLPEITEDFRAAGVSFDQLTPSLRIPVDWVGQREFTAELGKAYGQVLAAYHRPIPSEAELREQVTELLADGLLDFAQCPSRLQQLVVRQVSEDASRRRDLQRLNPVLDAALTRRPGIESSTSRNAEAVRLNYNLQASGARLDQLYRRVSESPRGEHHGLPRTSAILDAFLSLQRFQPIRIE